MMRYHPPTDGARILWTMRALAIAEPTGDGDPRVSELFHADDHRQLTPEPLKVTRQDRLVHIDRRLVAAALVDARITTGSGRPPFVFSGRRPGGLATGRSR
jgi:hypothetical protein